MQNPMSMLACIALAAGCVTQPATGNFGAEEHDSQSSSSSKEAPKPLEAQVGAATPAATPPAKPAEKPADKAYIGQIYVKVRANLVLDADTPKDLKAAFVVTQTRDGVIQSVKLKSASGYRPFDSAVERAILKSSPLPKAASEDVFKSEITLFIRSSK